VISAVVELEAPNAERGGGLDRSGVAFGGRGAVMDKLTFWELIDDTRRQAEGDLDAHVELLRERLQALEPADIIQFDKIFREYWTRAYAWDLWGAAYIIGGGCSDDGFLDFRGWLISKGERAYEYALKDPESLIKVVKDEDDDCQYEGFQYVASQAWENKTGKGMDDFPDSGLHDPREPSGQAWAEDSDDLERRFPKLSKRFS
jgi:hypothetical protein